MEKMSEKVTFVVMILLLLLVGGMVGYKIASLNPHPANTNQVVANVPVQNANTNTVVTPPEPVSNTVTVLWNQKLTEVSAAELAQTLGVPFTDVETPNSYTSSTFYKAGTVTSGKYTGGDFLVALVPCHDLCFHPNKANLIVDKKTKRLVNLSSYGFSREELFDAANVDGSTIEKFVAAPGNIVVDDPNIEVQNLKPAPVYAITGSSYTLKLSESEEPFLVGKTPVKEVGKTTDGKTIYTNEESGCLLIQLPDLSYHLYDLQIPFATTNLVTTIPDIKWKDGTKNDSDYSFADFGGCGASNCFAVRDESVVKSATRLIEVGKTSTNEVIYGLKDANDKELKDFYAEYKGTPSDPSNIAAYKTMTANHPVLYWKDPFGRWVRMTKTMYMPAVECGKPVIYLYPEKEMSVHVSVGLKGKMTQSEPAYGTRGWNVTAMPDGYVKNNADGKTYPNLYWEGTGVNYTVPTEGFVVKGTETDAWLKKTLATIGFTERESKEFREFWVPRLPKTPYVFMTFVPQENFDRDARLFITPAPQHVTRVFMEYRGLNAPESVRPLALPRIVRDGFTVVEWGGALRK